MSYYDAYLLERGFDYIRQAEQNARDSLRRSQHEAKKREYLDKNNHLHEFGKDFSCVFLWNYIIRL